MKFHKWYLVKRGGRPRQKNYNTRQDIRSGFWGDSPGWLTEEMSHAQLPSYAEPADGFRAVCGF